MYNLSEVLTECKKELDKLGIEYAHRIVINDNDKSRYWGLTRRENGYYTIEIASTLLDERNPRQALKQTVMHELLHTCKNSMGHTGDWKTYANLVNKVYGYDVERVNSSENLGIVVDTRPAKYKYVCQKCGEMLVRQRACDFTKHTECYKHTGCGGKFVRVY